MFTGSTETARTINRTLAERDGPIIPFIAETGGQNAMIVDCSALPEQVTRDVISSAFQSAGQRCSALRVLFVQDDVADQHAGDDRRRDAGADDRRSRATLDTDVGPVIDEGAKAALDEHLAELEGKARLLAEIELPRERGARLFRQAVDVRDRQSRRSGPRTFRADPACHPLEIGPAWTS